MTITAEGVETADDFTRMRISAATRSRAICSAAR
jgi:hypothetical protein